MGPYAGVGVGRAGVKEIAGRHEELHGAAALDEDDFLLFIEVHELPEQVFRLVKHVLEFFRAVTDFCDAHAGISEIREILLHGLQDFQRHGGGAGVEIVYSVHFFTPGETI